MHEHDAMGSFTGVTDAQLVRRARRGDESAFHALVDRHAQGLFRLAYSLVGNAADAEDVVQETFAGAFKGLPGFREDASAKTWLVRILVRQAARLRRGARPADSAAVEVVHRDSAGAVDAKLDVAAMLQSLSAEHREVLALRELQGLSYGEMAEILGVPQGTVESRLHRARQELRQRYQEFGPE